MTRSEILETAHLYIMHDRASTHGGAEDSFGDIAAMWSIYLGHAVGPEDVAMMMVLLKAVRFKNSPQHVDNTIDVAGYAALAGEIALRDKS
jgi:hypothetical protein